MQKNHLDIEYLRAKYSSARNKYKPSHIQTLLIVEAPPCSLDRYFYFEDVKMQDSLFLEIMGVLYPVEKDNYLKTGRESHKKMHLLEKFKTDGYWLLDLAEIPIEVSNESYENSLPSLLSRLKKYIDKKVRIILIKANVYDICFDTIFKIGYNVINERIPFPGSGQQRIFREKFKNSITS